MHLVAVDLTTGSMAFCVSKEKSIPAVCNIFDSIMHLQKALRSLREKSWKNNLLFASPSIRRPTLYCKRLGINYNKLSDVEFRQLVHILEKSKYFKSYVGQRKKRK